MDPAQYAQKRKKLFKLKLSNMNLEKAIEDIEKCIARENIKLSKLLECDAQKLVHYNINKEIIKELQSNNKAQHVLFPNKIVDDAMLLQ